MGTIIKFIGQFVSWLFTDPLGAIFQGAAWGIIMAIATHLSGQFSQYGVLSYCVAFFIFFFAAVILALLAGWLWTHIANRIGTKKPTFVEYRFQNGRLQIIGKSNIYKEPTCVVAPVIPQSLNILIAQPPPVNRQQRRAQGKTVSQTQAVDALPQQPVIPSPLQPPQAQEAPKMTAFIIFMFEKPILPSMFLLRVESSVGALPATDRSGIDEKWAHIALSSLSENSSFKICFN